jgi:hypothetical protein
MSLFIRDAIIQMARESGLIDRVHLGSDAGRELSTQKMEAFADRVAFAIARRCADIARDVGDAGAECVAGLIEVEFGLMPDAPEESTQENFFPASPALAHSIQSAVARKLAEGLMEPATPFHRHLPIPAAIDGVKASIATERDALALKIIARGKA